MASGLMALLDDVVMISKLAAASVDDALGQAAKAGSKAAGVVIDDTAVTPTYVVGLSPQREIPMIWKITKGSFFNKLVILLPAALVLDYFAPWVITPLLTVGGVYLCFEGAEKLLEHVAPHAAHELEGELANEVAMSAKELEDSKVKGAVRTDFILSAEIMTITLANVSDGMPVPTDTYELVGSLIVKFISMGLVAIAITVAVYGVVGLIVKADDAGLAMARNKLRSVGLRKLVASIGYGLVQGMPKLLAILAAIGTAAMLWVGGSIIVHGLAFFGYEQPEHLIHGLASTVGHVMPEVLVGSAEWVATAAAQGVLGIIVGVVTIPLVGKLIAPLVTALKPKGKTA
jgi:predicted DNA repair protein MutK